MQHQQAKAYIDLKNGDYRIVRLKSDNTVLRIVAKNMNKRTAQYALEGINKDNGWGV